jgi:hypothetical protein
MTSTRRDQSGEKRARQAYNAFVRQIQIQDIRLVSAKVENLDCSYFPSSAEVKWKMAARYENIEQAFRAYQRYNVVIADEESKEIKAKISVTFCVTYPSKITMNDELFGTFKLVNLPVNTWPYFREFTHNAVLRMGWPPFITPTFVS